MRGLLVVAENPDEFFAKNPEPKVKVTNWKIDDFTDAYAERPPQLERQRSDPRLARVSSFWR